MVSGEVDPLIIASFEPVKHDLGVAGLHAKLRQDTSGMRDGRAWATLYVNGQRLGILSADPASGEHERVWLLADTTQELVLEGLRAGNAAVVWPRCEPGHTHPMISTRTEQWPDWTCPHDSTHRIPVGSLPDVPTS